MKPKRWINKKYREWVSGLPCCVCRKYGPNDPHHVRTNGNAGTGQKPSDSWCIPLCHDHHTEVHHHGAKTFEDKYNIDLIFEVLKTTQKWIENNKI